MPRFVDVSKGVVPGERQEKFELIGIRRQPSIRIGVFELFAADIDGAAAVMLAVAGRGIDSEDVTQAEPLFEFAANDGGLVFHASKCRNHQQFDAIVSRRRLESLPCLCGSWR